MLTTLLLQLACSNGGPRALATRIESLEDAIGGPKATAQPGDILLQNERVRFAIVGTRSSPGPGIYGGSIVDADLVRADPEWAGGHGNDHFAEMFPTVNMNLAAVDGLDDAGNAIDSELTIVSDGSEGGDAIVRADAGDEPFFSLLGALWAIVAQPQMRITTDYVLSPGVSALKIRTTVSFTDPATTPEPPAGALLPGVQPGEPDLPLLDQAISTGMAFGDFYLQGGAVDVFAPGIGFDEDGAVFEANARGQNTFTSPFRFPFIAGVADGVSYGMAATDGDLFVPLFTSSQTAAFGAGITGDGSRQRFPADAAYSYERWFAVGKGDVGSVLDALIEARGVAHGTVRGHVLEDGTGVPLSHVSVLVFAPGADKPYSQWLTDVGEDGVRDGSFGGSLPIGDWELVVHKQGRPEGARVPVTVTDGSSANLALSSPRPGQVRVRVVDETGRPVPAKVTFRSENALSPAKGDAYIPGGPSEVVFAPNGAVDVVLPPGNYTAVASRGLEYELDESAPFDVGAATARELTLQVARSIDTSGWMSADFHVHAVNSFDSGTRLTDRVATMVCEGVEFFTSTDHDFLTDYAPVVEDLGLEPWVKTAVGLETTTLEIGHFIGFPMEADTTKGNGGSFDWTGMEPKEILATLKERGEASGYDPVRIVAHPRDGILGYFDQYGWDAYSGQVSTPTLSLTNPLLAADAFSEDFEALELLNGKRIDLIRTPTQGEMDAYAAGEAIGAYDLIARTAEEQAGLESGVMHLGYGQEGQVDDWFALLNLGKRVTALGNSDTHGKYTIEAGCPRNYVMVGEDDPASLDEQAVADAVRAGKVVASYGPFVRAWINAPENGIGSELVDMDGSVELSVEVQAPSWVPVDRVEVYQNGALVHAWEDLTGGDTLRLDQSVTLPVDRDSWFVVIAVGNGDLSPVFTPVEMPPVELQDVVTEALSGVPGIGNFLSPAVPILRTGPVVPFAITNPIRVDVDGAGWTAPGLPAWFQPPVEPSEE